MLPALCAVLPLVVAQQPTLLYNGGTPETANCPVKTNACDCHYASCTLAGVCACGWDDATRTCKAGIPTKCVACPAMRHCSVSEKLKIGPDGFPVPGQLAVWGNVEYPDHSGEMPLEGPGPRNPPPQTSVPMTRMPAQTTPVTRMPQQPQTVQVTQSSSQMFGQPQSVASQAAPISLYQNNPLSAGGCALLTEPCGCHYASCTPTGDCICGWDTKTSTCRAGIPTQCVSCPSMHRCGVNEPLLIGPNGFPVPGQLSVWGQVPYPDEEAPTAAPPSAAAPTAKAKAPSAAAPAPTAAAPTAAAPTTKAKGKGKGKGKKGKKAGKNTGSS